MKATARPCFMISRAARRKLAPQPSPPAPSAETPRHWWIVRTSDKQCLVVPTEPTVNDKYGTKIGKTVYLTREEAEAGARGVAFRTI